MKHIVSKRGNLESGITLPFIGNWIRGIDIVNVTESSVPP